jgi:hypothetical protein
MRLLFAAVTPAFAPDKIISRQPRGLKQPTGKGFALAQPCRLPGENDEDGLGDVLGLVLVAHLPHCDRINQIGVPRHQRCKCFVGTIFRILPQQRIVIHWLHLPISVRHTAKTDNYLSKAHWEALYPNFAGVTGEVALGSGRNFTPKYPSPPAPDTPARNPFQRL